MIGIPLKTVLAEIDATGTEDVGRRIAIRYVCSKGHIRPMIISKRKAKTQQERGGNSSRPKSNPHYKNNYLIPIIDHTHHDQAKDLFALGIIGFNPEPDIDLFYPIIREYDSAHQSK